MSDEQKSVHETDLSTNREQAEKVNKPDPNPIVEPAAATESNRVPVWHYVVIAVAAIAASVLAVYLSH